MVNAKDNGKLQTANSFFSKRHYMWLIDMAIETDMTISQCSRLSQMLIGSNPLFDKSRFDRELTLTRNGRSGGI